MLYRLFIPSIFLCFFLFLPMHCYATSGREAAFAWLVNEKSVCVQPEKCDISAACLSSHGKKYPTLALSGLKKRGADSAQSHLKLCVAPETEAAQEGECTLKKREKKQKAGEKQGGVKSIIITSTDTESMYEQLLYDFLPLPSHLNCLTYSADVAVSVEEFNYLVGLQKDNEVTVPLLLKAIRHLKQKNKFESITIQAELGENGIDIHIALVGLWTLSSVKIRGVSVGRQQYQQYYVMEPGDPFDKYKHMHSIEKIVEACKNQGYFDAKATAVFSHNDDQKTVSTVVTLHRASRFTLGKVGVGLVADECAAGDGQLFLKRQIQRKFLRALPQAAYEKGTLIRIASNIKDFLTSHGFLHVSIFLDECVDGENKQVNLVWRIELHHKCAFIFCGNRFFTNEQLKEVVMQFGRSAWLLPASILAQEINRVYWDKGFWSALVESQDEAQRYFFLITEGGRALIDSVEIKNAIYIDERTLIKNCFSSLLKNHYFSQELLSQSFNNVVDFYLERDFLDLDIVGHEFIPSEKVNSYKLVVTVDEGCRRYIRRIEIMGHEYVEYMGPFNDFLKASEPILFRSQLIKQHQNWLVSYFQDKGCHGVVCKPELIKDGLDGIIIKWRIDVSKSQLYFGKTVLLGSGKLNFNLILRELCYKQGEPWDQEKLRQSFLNLKGLDIFESIRLYPTVATGMDGQKDVLLKLQHDDPFEVRLRTGLELQYVRNYGTFAGITYKLGGTFIARNPTNSGDIFLLDTDFTRAHREIVGKYKWPGFLGTSLRSVVQGYSIVHEHPGYIGSKRNIYTVTQNGFLCGVSKKNSYLDGEINIGCEWMQTKLKTESTDTAEFVLRLARAINFDPALLHKKIPFFFLEPTLFVDCLDNKLQPTRGTLTVLSMKGMFPLSHTNDGLYFIKALIEQSVFFPLGPMVGGLRLRLGHIFHRQFDKIMPTERFYLGGANSLRGYETDLAPPVGIFVDPDENGECYFVPRGGKSMININAELRVPLFQDIWGVVFQDMGMLSGDRMADFRAKNMLCATGFGLRYQTPIGPLRFDIGFKWRKFDPSERRYSWVLTFGQAF